MCDSAVDGQVHKADGFTKPFPLMEKHHMIRIFACKALCSFTKAHDTVKYMMQSKSAT